MPKPWKINAKPADSIQTNESKLFAAEFGGYASEIDLHGMDPQSAMHELDIFLHAAYVHGDDVVKVIHGRGTGKMRETVKKFLRDQSIVETSRDAYHMSESSGVTYVVLKKK